MTDGNSPDGVERGSRGIVFATTGGLYTDLARRAARTIRTVMPEVLIDLFTDQHVDDGVFDRVHSLPDSWFRPKIYAIRNARFERSIVLDADIVVLADISELFDVLDRFDMAGVLGFSRRRDMVFADPQVPGCLQPVNSGVLAVRASARTRAFARVWEQQVRAGPDILDQPAFRRLLFLGDLDFVTLGPAYNCINLDLLDSWRLNMGAPRILHVRALHNDHPGNPEQPFDLVDVIGETRAQHVKHLLAADWQLGGDPKLMFKTPMQGLRDRLGALEKEAGAQTVSLKGGRRPDKGPGRQHSGGDLTLKPQQKLRRQLRQIEAAAYHAAILGLASQHSPLRICVVGANDGKLGDPLYRLVKTQLRSMSDMLLIEPQAEVIPFLQKNYGFHPSHRIIAAAVGPAKILTLHAVRPECWARLQPPYASGWPSYRAPSGVTSGNRAHVVAWVQKHLPQEPDPDSLVAELSVRSAPLVTLLAECGWERNIDVLQVDAEGFDDEVIYACEIEVTRPAIIRFEASLLSADRLRRLTGYLADQYTLIEGRQDMLAIRRAHSVSSLT